MDYKTPLQTIFAESKAQIAELEAQIADLYVHTLYGPNHSFNRKDSLAKLKEGTRFFILCQVAHQTCSILYKLLFPLHYSGIRVYPFSQIHKEVLNAKRGICRRSCEPENQKLHCENAVRVWDHICNKIKINTDNVELYEDLFLYFQDESRPIGYITESLNKETLYEAVEQYFIDDIETKSHAIQIIYMWDYVKKIDLQREESIWRQNACSLYEIAYN